MNNLPPLTYPRVPILIYHHISEVPKDSLAVDPKMFQTQMNYLLKSGFETISLYQLYQAYYLNLQFPQKPIIITFDDGVINQYTNAFPMLLSFGFNATFFIPVEAIQTRQSDNMTWEQLAQMKQRGMFIEAHSISHSDLRKLSAAEQTNEIYGSKELIESNLGTPVKFFAFPYGVFNNTSLIILRRCGYLGAVSGIPGKVEIGEDLYTLKRIFVDGGASLEDFKRLVTS